MKLSVTETSGATFTSYKPYETTIEEMIAAGHAITMSDEHKLANGGIVVLVSYNRVGTATKRVLRKIA